MADNILKLKVESSDYDAKLKKAAEGIRHLADVAHKGGGELTGLEKAELDYIKALGDMETKSRTASGQARELTNTYKELKVVYNQLNDVEKADEGGKALAASLETIKQRAQEAKKELAEVTAELDGKSSVGKGGFLSGMGDKMSGALQVFAGNMLTKGVSMLTSELAGAVQQSIELARQGEGVRMAFERLDQPGLLDSLKEATHGTISELELMKQAVKFENFKLPVEDLANYLAFAQQKAKDTGESIDYLVNSITTGLGRQSKQILDNLGISAAELTRRMNEGATMTQAVSDIIREEMAKAGDYVETAADRAARAAADTQNKMEELGRSAMPVAEEFASAWAEIRNGAMTLVLPVLSTVADSIRDIREILAGEWDMPKLKPGIPNLAEGPANSNQPKRPTWGDVPVVKAPGGYVEVTDQSGKVLHGGHYDSDAQLQNMIKRWNTLTSATGGTRRASSSSRQQTEMQRNQTRINDLTQQYVTLMAAASKAGKPLTDEQQKQTSEIQRQIAELEKRNGQLKLYQEQAQGRLMGVDVMTGGLSRTGGVTGFIGTGKSMMPIEGLPSMSDVVRQRGGNLLDDKAMKAVNEDISRNLPNAKEEDKRDDPLKEAKKQNQKLEGIGSDISGMLSGLEKMGIEIPEGLSSMVGGIQTITGIISSILTLVGVISALTSVKSVPIFGWLLAQGGIAGGLGGRRPIHAAGGTVVGNTYSGDQIPAMLNAGEVVLNRAQQGNIASQLENGASQNLKLDAVVTGEQIRLVLNNNGRRTGRGEYVTSNRR